MDAQTTERAQTYALVQVMGQAQADALVQVTERAKTYAESLDAFAAQPRLKWLITPTGMGLDGKSASMIPAASSRYAGAVIRSRRQQKSRPADTWAGGRAGTPQGGRIGSEARSRSITRASTQRVREASQTQKLSQ